jgi:hypothetical protein
MTDRSIIVHGLRKRYGKIVALDGLSFDVPAGTIVGLLGANGSVDHRHDPLHRASPRPGHRHGVRPRRGRRRGSGPWGWSGSRASTRLWTPTSPGRRTSP